jgi:hypothetical protein
MGLPKAGAKRSGEVGTRLLFLGMFFAEELKSARLVMSKRGGETGKTLSLPEMRVVSAGGTVTFE